MSLTPAGWLMVIGLPLGAWLWLAIFRPMGPCWRCRGRRRKGSRTRWRNLKCERCGSTGEHMRLSARIVRGQGRGWGK